LRWASAASRADRFDAGLAGAAADLHRTLGGARADLLLAFVSHEHRDHYAAVSALSETFEGALLVGCSAGSVIGGGHEIEDGPGVALCAAQLPGVDVEPLRLDAGSEVDVDAAAEEWAARARGPGPDDPHLLLLAEPFGLDTEPFLAALDDALPGVVKLGGLASGGTRPGENALFLGGTVLRAGAVGVALRGNLAVDTVVAQGCRPVGSPMFVTSCRENVLLQVDGRPPTEVLNRLFENADPREQALFRSSLFLGIEMDPDRTEYGRGDFLVRNLIGADPETGAIAVAAPLRETQVVQFHVRDAHTAADDLEQRLARHGPGSRAGSAPAGALLFSCLGRGRQLYGAPDHDTHVFQRRVGDVPLAGFFCNGEIGPVGGRTFLHGYTSAFGIFRPRTPSS